MPTNLRASFRGWQQPRPLGLRVWDTSAPHSQPLSPCGPHLPFQPCLSPRLPAKPGPRPALPKEQLRSQLEAELSPGPPGQPTCWSPPSLCLLTAHKLPGAGSGPRSSRWYATATRPDLLPTARHAPCPASHLLYRHPPPQGLHRPPAWILFPRCASSRSQSSHTGSCVPWSGPPHHLRGPCLPCSQGSGQPRSTPGYRHPCTLWGPDHETFPEAIRGCPHSAPLPKSPLQGLRAALRDSLHPEVPQVGEQGP